MSQSTARKQLHQGIKRPHLAHHTRDSASYHSNFSSQCELIQHNESVKVSKEPCHYRLCGYTMRREDKWRDGIVEAHTSLKNYTHGKQKTFSTLKKLSLDFPVRADKSINSAKHLDFHECSNLEITLSYGYNTGTRHTASSTLETSSLSSATTATVDDPIFNSPTSNISRTSHKSSSIDLYGIGQWIGESLVYEYVAQIGEDVLEDAGGYSDDVQKALLDFEEGFVMLGEDGAC